MQAATTSSISRVNLFTREILVAGARYSYFKLKMWLARAFYGYFTGKFVYAENYFTQNYEWGV